MACIQKFTRLNIRSYYKIGRLYSTQLTTHNSNIQSIVTTNFIKNPWIYQQQTTIETPYSKITPVIELPRSIFWIPPKIDPESIINSDVSDPLSETNKIEKQAVKLIVIRRHKMRKHKLRKLRKKMKFEWAKRRQRRELKKEKLFQGELIAQIKNAEKFSAQEFVAEKLRKATEIPIPRLWKGRRLPEFIIREKLGLPPK